MHSDRTLLALTSSGLIGVAVAGAWYATRRTRRPTLMLSSEWGIDEADVLLDLRRLV